MNDYQRYARDQQEARARIIKDINRSRRYHTIMSWVWGAATVVLVALAIMVLGAFSAQADTRPCGLGGNNRENRAMSKCLSKQPGIRVNRATAVSVGNCESGFNRMAHSHPYHGIYQLLSSEFGTFQHQGPRWVDREFREYDYGIHSARGNVLAAFAHAHDQGWGAWSCA